MAILEEFEQTSIGILHDINIPLPSNFLDKVIYRVKKLSLSSKLNAIPVHSIMTKCVLMEKNTTTSLLNQTHMNTTKYFNIHTNLHT